MTFQFKYFVLFLWVSAQQWTSIFSQFVDEANRQRSPLALHEVPFVPEEFRSARKRIIFDKDDFLSLLPSPEAGALRDSILAVMIETQARANITQIYNGIDLTYAGMAKLGGRPGHSAHFAATVKLQVCDDSLLAACHMEECDLDLDQKDEADPHDYKPIFALHSKECQRLDSWCYFCQAFDHEDRPMEGATSCANIHLPMKKNCNANIGDLSVKEKWGCKTTYTIVAGQYEVIDKDCIAVPFTVNDPSVNCQSLDESDYEVQCLCYNESGCNQHNEAKVEALIKATNNDPVLAEVNKSIRQLRADLKRTIQRYSRQMNPEGEEEDEGAILAEE